MANKTQALYGFWSGFRIPAIDEQSSYDTATMEQLGITYPYITFESAVGEFGEEITLGADLYYRSSTWAEIESKAAEIADAIGYAGTLVPYDGGGAIWIKRGNPIYRRMGADNAFDIRRIHFDVTAAFLSV